MTTTHYGQRFTGTEAYRQITVRVILQPDITQSHYYQDSYPTSATSMQYDRQLIRLEQVPSPCFFKEQLQRRMNPSHSSIWSGVSVFSDILELVPGTYNWTINKLGTQRTWQKGFKAYYMVVNQKHSRRKIFVMTK